MARQASGAGGKGSILKDILIRFLIALVFFLLGFWLGESKKQAQIVIKEADYVDSVVDRADHSIENANSLLDRRPEPGDQTKVEQEVMRIARTMMEDIESARAFATEYSALLEEKFKPLREAVASGDAQQVADAMRELKVSFEGKANQVDEAKQRRLRGLQMPPVPTPRNPAS